MIIKTGRYWPFLACSSYPECKNIESIKDPKQEILEVILEEKWLLVDEETWAELVVKNSKRWLFLAAKEYPKVKIAKPIPKDVLEELKNRT
jgi:DNA topoisomerase-1